MTEKIKLNVSILPDCETIFWGRSCEDILKEEFRNYLNGFEGNGYHAEISSRCPLADLQTVLALIKTMQGAGTMTAAGGAIKITNTEEKSKGEKTEKGVTLLFADINRDRIQINEILRKRIIDSHIGNGVYITDPSSAYIDFDAVIESGVTVYHNNFIRGKSVIKRGCVLMPNNTITDSVLSENVVSTASTFNGAFVDEGAAIGPNAYLRPKAKVGKNCKIGDFVEVKNAVIGNGTKVSHLAYVGDAEIGENCNIGCGVIFVNYNGKTKSKSAVGDNSFIGSNCNIVAPVKIGSKVFVAAGTTVTNDLKDGDFCIGRVRPEIKEDRAKNYL